MADYPELAYWLALITESSLKLSVVKPIIQRWSLVEKRPLAELFELSPLEWSTAFEISAEQARRGRATADKLDKALAAVQQWQAQGIETLTRIDPRYPARLAYILPPALQPYILWARGNLELLNEPGVAILGSEATLDEATAASMEALLKALAAEGIGLVSGYERGLSRTLFEATLATPGGQAVAILPMGLSAFAQTTTKLDTAVEQNKTVLLSPFSPETAFDEKLAEARNLLIDHLALALLIPLTGAAEQERARAALDQGRPVFVGLKDTPGNRALIDMGALLLTDAGEVIEVVQQALIDATLYEPEEEETPVPARTAPAKPEAEDDDYSLPVEEVGLISQDEAMEILSMGGEIPDVLRQRLKKSSPEDDTT